MDYKALWNSFKLNGDGLIPAIVQDFETQDVLMLAYMNEESFNLTCEGEFAVYYSRSRQKLWKKGETSGHLQRVVEVRKDCDSDTLLLKVIQTGPACHTGNRSCFFDIIMRKEIKI